jgi:hypothetical protein
VSEEFLEATLLDVLPDGTFRVQVGEEERIVRLEGLAAPQPLPPDFIALVQRCAASGRPWRLVLTSDDRAVPTGCRVQCYGWQDKSGDVWLDLGALLIERGLASETS